MIVRPVRFSQDGFRALVKVPYAFRFGDDLEIPYPGVVIILSCKNLEMDPNVETGDLFGSHGWLCRVKVFEDSVAYFERA